MKKAWIFLGVLLVVMIGGIFAFKGFTHYDEKINHAERFKKEYESLNGTKNGNGKEYRTVSIPKENPYYYISAEDLATKIEKKETMMVYFGFKSCPWCRSIIEELTTVAKELGVERVYYVDILEIRDTISFEDGVQKKTKEGSEGYTKLLKLLEPVLQDYTIKNEAGETIETGEKRIYAPNVVAIVNGEARALEEGVSESQTDGYQEITEEMRAETKAKFKKVFEELLKEEGETCEEETAC